MSELPLHDWLQRLEQLHPSEIELGLERITVVAHRLDLLPVPVPVITVAGTNGKGSTVAVLEALYGQAGQRCGSFTSPHFLRFNERIRIAGTEASDAAITRAFAAIEAARGDTSLTYFEFAALAALLIFAAESLDVVILEVGLGGRLDAVNIVDPSVAVITSIALDHQGWLGDTREEIAVEKAGILRAGRPVVIADEAPPSTLIQTIKSVGATPALFLGTDFEAQAVEQGQCCISVLDASGDRRVLPPLTTQGLMPQNIAAAIQAALTAGVELSDEAITQAINAVSLRGRRQQLQHNGVRYLLDVAHNPDAVAQLVSYLEGIDGEGRVIAVFSVMQDKDYAAMLQSAVHAFDAWLLAEQPGNARAASASELANVLADLDVERVSHNKNLRQALARAAQLAAPGDTVVVFGSFTTVAAALDRLAAEEDVLKEAG